MELPTNRPRVAVWINSEPWHDREGQARTATLLLYSSPDHHLLLLKTGERQPSNDVTWRVDQAAEVADSWTSPPWAQKGELLPLTGLEMMRKMKGASRFSIKTAATPELVFFLGEALETSLQANIDRCGLNGFR